MRIYLEVLAIFVTANIIPALEIATEIDIFNGLKYLNIQTAKMY